MRRIQCKWCEAIYEVRKNRITVERSNCWQCSLPTWNADAITPEGKKIALMGIDPEDLGAWLEAGAKELEYEHE